MKKKLLPILLLVVIVFNFIFCSLSYADPGEGSTSMDRYGGNATIKGGAVQELIDNGKDTNGTEFSHKNFGSHIVGMVMQYIAAVINSFPIAIQSVITILTKTPTDGNLVDKALKIGEALINPDHHFTVEKVVFNEIALFNINVFNQEETYTNGLDEHSETITQHATNLKFKESTAKWFYTCRLLAMMINLCILVYVGIRMALSTIASEEAKYKKMLMAWLESMVILFLLHYIMLITVSFGEIVLNILNDIRYNLIATTGNLGFEDIILQKIYWMFNEGAGMQFFTYSLFFWFLTWIQLKFFFSYFKRFLSVMFLTIIGPFITVTYPIDKIGDGKAQAFEFWFKEYMINVALQPIHAAIYLVFVYTAGKIAEQAPFVAMVFLLSLGTVENIVRNIFGITNSITMKNIDSEVKGKGKK